mmetsp:Transcript_60921/g.140808  ORF Transcript_60921/g.140808 Transcript_60921/m.140808 type:complete len:236 (-) Transcript_60921:248-955(-)
MVNCPTLQSFIAAASENAGTRLANVALHSCICSTAALYCGGKHCLKITGCSTRISQGVTAHKVAPETGFPSARQAAPSSTPLSASSFPTALPSTSTSKVPRLRNMQVVTASPCLTTTSPRTTTRTSRTSRNRAINGGLKCRNTSWCSNRSIRSGIPCSPSAAISSNRAFSWGKRSSMAWNTRRWSKAISQFVDAVTRSKFPEDRPSKLTVPNVGHWDFSQISSTLISATSLSATP